jgi:hypothetical protein
MSRLRNAKVNALAVFVRYSPNSSPIRLSYAGIYSCSVRNKKAVEDPPDIHQYESDSTVAWPYGGRINESGFSLNAYLTVMEKKYHKRVIIV